MKRIVPLITACLFVCTSMNAQIAAQDLYTLKDSAIHIEGISTGNDARSFFVGGVNTGALYELNGGNFSLIPLPAEWPAWSLMGMTKDRSGDLLFIARTALPSSPDNSLQFHGADIVVFDIRKRRFLKRIPMVVREETVLFNDIALSTKGDLLVSDAGKPGGVYQVSWQQGDFRALNTKGIRSPQGIVATDSALYIAGYGQGLFRYDIRVDSAQFLPVEGLNEELKVMDGLTVFDNRIIAVCNGNRKSVIAIGIKDLVGAVIADLNLARYSEPTLCSIYNQRLYFVANSQWESYASPGVVAPARTPAIISSIDLPEALRSIRR